MSASIAATRTTFALDCPDAVALAEFYAALLGWDVVRGEGRTDWVEVHPATGNHVIAFQRVPHYRAPEWPDGPTPQQAHLDFYVADLATSETVALAAGALRHPVQPSENGSFIVFTDPVGHPFCLCQGD